ncbi:hypothetical protein FAGAP_747 [Fusarium agapanthi]|uniref:Uncharacterized protein n=1 Tax=Fusarium agapanthi TaxID=1803897 RepID=A0A9P5EHY4_9HYPO|nr:hypothetical protein FAGAP_747 [Fusarium agapanthi]
MSDPASQIRIQDSKQRLQQAYTHAVPAKESAESDFKQEKDAGMTDGQDFRNWSAQNAPAWRVALKAYQGAKAAYDAALQDGDIEAFQAWDKKYEDVMMANPGNPNYEALVEP